MCYSRRKNTQFCNINIAIRGIFVAQSAIIICLLYTSDAADD